MPCEQRTKPSNGDFVFLPQKNKRTVVPSIQALNTAWYNLMHLLDAGYQLVFVLGDLPGRCYTGRQ